MPLMVPIREAQRAHLEQRAQAAVKQIVRTLRDARIGGRVRAQWDQQGRRRLVVLIRGAGAAEAELLLNPTIGGFPIVVV
jgi:hypothetical protein